jgi:16S rRNA (guanine1207-N2)-methyltransferase
MKKQPVPLIRDAVLSRLKPPVVFVLGSPGELADVSFQAQVDEGACYQMDLYLADRVRESLEEAGVPLGVTTAPDLWDLPAEFQTALYVAPKSGERDLKIDMVEQAFHVLRPGGSLVVVSPFAQETLFPNLLKKVFGKVKADTTGTGSIFWCQRQGDRPRRRHELTFQVRTGEGPSLRFLSRPGTFSYGRFDLGARALVEVMEVEAGDRVLDVGCGCGTNGVIAGLRAGATGHVTFVDSNIRAVSLAEHNARQSGLTSFEAVASAAVEVPGNGYDVALANPPYYAQESIARLFIDRCRELLKPGGRFYLVTKQPEQMTGWIDAAFADTQALLHRGYHVFSARAEKKGGKDKRRRTN